MGVTSFDSATGKPVFNSTPQTQSDLQAAADYAASQGPISVGSFSALSSIPFKRAGMVAEVADTGRLYKLKADATTWQAVDRISIYNASPTAREGANWDGVSPLIEKVGSVVITANASSIGNFNWPGGAFPNGLLSVQLTSGDYTVTAKILVPGGSTSRSQCVFQALTGGGAGVGAVGVRVDFRAVGW